MTLKLHLQAGLGNQLFMIFALVSYAIDHGIKYTILSFFDKTLNGTKVYWDTLLDSFKNYISEEHNNYSNEYIEPCFEYKELPHELALSDYKIKGFFQSYKYFEHNYEKILEIMKFNEKIMDIRNNYGHIIKRKTIAIHFRIGDYIGLQNYHCIKGPEYYINALKTIEIDLNSRGENIKDYDILYFCQKQDEYCIQQILNIIQQSLNTSYNFYKIPDDIDDWKQMLIMSLCDHFIIANSTFSWFGAYFCNKKDKLVYYPNIWFGPALIKNNINDLCPKVWKAI